jgi:hypothetical protein
MRTSAPKEKNVKKQTLQAMAVLSVMILVTVSAYAEWGPWQVIGDGQVAVSFSQVNADTCTWQIKNTGPNTLKTFEFSYTYVPVNSPYSQKTDKDILPYPLKPGASVGGWTTYSASTHRCPATLGVLKLGRGNQ